MARKASAGTDARGFNDIIGIVLMGFAALLLVALISYDPRDVSRQWIANQSRRAKLDRAIWCMDGLCFFYIGRSCGL